MPVLNTHFCLHLIKHYLSATRIDVLHSPFIFNLYNSCIARQKPLPEFAPIEDLRKDLKQNKQVITQTDFGASGEQQPVKQKTIAQLASLHAKPARLGQLIYRLTAQYRYTHILELGTSLGITGSYIAKALQQHYQPAQVNFHTIEGSVEIASQARKNFEALQLHNYVRQMTGNFDEVLDPVLKAYEQIDLAFIDGNHRYAPTLEYFNKILPLCHNDTLLIFDDIYWSEGMTKAWEEIKAHPSVTVSVDLFFIGLVYFRKEQVKEHFKLRIW